MRGAGSGWVAPAPTDLLVKLETKEAPEEIALPPVMKKAVKQSETNVARDRRAHTEQFAEAMKYFHQGSFERAARLFEEAATGAHIGVNESAQMYARMCRQRLEQASVELKTPEDYYNYAVGLINARRFREARESLEKALAAGQQAHMVYALALVEGHLGSMDAAVTHLRQAIQMDPSVRGLARSDPDFAPLLSNARLREALAPAQGPGD